MFRLIQDIQPQKFLLEKCLHSMQWSPKPSVPVKFADIERSTIMEKGFENQNIVITSGAGVLGRDLAKKLGQLNATVAVWDSNKEALDKTAKAVKGIDGVYGFICDLTRKEDIYRTADKTIRDLGQVTIVINNADAAAEQLFLDTPDYLIERVFNINIMSHFWTAKAFLPNMIDRNMGHIVTISSMAGHMGIQKLTDYCASKAAAASFLAALKTELEREGSNGVKTTIICPYFIKSTETDKGAELRVVPALNPDEVTDRIIKAIKKQEDVVFIPGWFRLAMLPKWITPSAISSMLLRLLIKDPTPNAVHNPHLSMVQFIRPGESVGFRRSEIIKKEKKEQNQF